MTATTRSGGGPGDGDAGTWATEGLPMSVRRELLERELKKLGFRKAGGPHDGAVAQQQQQPQRDSGHPTADEDGPAHGG